MENLIEELTKVNPSNLSEEGLKLFNKINEIIDRNKELEEENEGLQNQANNLVEEYEKEIAEKNEKIFGLENVCVSLHKLIDEEM